MKKLNLKGFILLVLVFFSFENFAQTNNSPYKDELTQVEVKLREGNFQAAVEILDNITAKYPNAADAYYGKALLFGQVGNLDTALENALQAYQLEPSKVHGNYLIDLYRSKKDWDKVIEIQKEIYAKYPTDSAVGRDLLTTLGFTDKFDDALSIYNLEVKKGNHSDTLDVALAEVYFHKKEFQKGIDLLLPWSNKSSLGEVYGRLGYGYLEAGKVKSAIAVLENGLVNSKDPILYLDLADAYKIDGKPKLTYESLNKAFLSTKVDYVHKYRVMLDLLRPNSPLTIDQIQNLSNTLALQHPRIAESHMLKGEVLWERGNPAEARSMFLTAVGIAPNQIDAWRMLINVDIAMKELDDAIQHSKEALTANPGNPTLLYFGGIAYMVKEENEMARQMLEAALNNGTNETPYLQSMIYGSLGDLYHKLNMESTSDVAYEEAIKLDSTNVMAMNNLAYYLSVRKKDLDKAAMYSLKSNELDPNSATFQDTYAWVLFQQGNYSEALKWIEKSVKASNPPSAVLLEHYGDILAQLGKTKDAVKQWQKALTLVDLSEKDKVKIEEKIKVKKYVE